MKATLLMILVTAILTKVSAVPDTDLGQERTLGYKDATILGIVEGLTEYLPVSSTGHLILTNELLGLNDDLNTTPGGIKDPQIIEPEDSEYTRAQAAYAFVIIIQIGAILAVALLYGNRIRAILLGFFGRDSDGLLLGVNILIAFLPAAIFGLLLDSLIERLLGQNVLAIAIALIVGAIVMLGVEARRHRRAGRSEIGKTDEEKSLNKLTPIRALGIGFAQCVAMWPGTSRSMATIIGGYLAGLGPKAAAEFSFLLGLVTLSAASGYKMLKDGQRMLEVIDLGPVLFGCAIAFCSAAIAIKWFVGFLTKHGLTLFAYYRILLAVVVMMFLR